MSRVLRLREHQTAPALPLDAAAVDGLRALGIVQLQPARGLPGRYDVTALGHVGVLRVGELTVSIAPKLPLARVLFLLSYAMDGRWQRDDAVSLPEDVDLLEAMVPFYAATVRRALRRGVLQGYRVRDEALPLVRGRLRIEDQIRSCQGVPLPAEVRYDDYTVDIDANRVLLAAARRLRRLPLRSAEARVPLRRLEAALEGVAAMDYGPRDIPRVALDRLSAHYEPAVELARRILAGTSWDIGAGDVQASGCLVDMSRVFEDFVVRALRERLGLGERALRQGKRLWLDRERRIAVRPDVSVWQRGAPVFVGDIKYKRLPGDLARHADLYQALAYTTAANLPSATLIYAAGEAEPATHRVVHAGKTLRVAVMDLGGSIADVQAEVARVAAMVAEALEGRRD